MNQAEKSMSRSSFFSGSPVYAGHYQASRRNAIEKNYPWDIPLLPSSDWRTIRFCIEKTKTMFDRPNLALTCVRSCYTFLVNIQHCFFFFSMTQTTPWLIQPFLFLSASLRWLFIFLSLVPILEFRYQYLIAKSPLILSVPKITILASMEGE